jgi:hypothetical protein
MIIQAFGEGSVSHTRVFEWHSRFIADQKGARQVKNKVKSMLITFFDVKGTVHKELSWQAKQ